MSITISKETLNNPYSQLPTTILRNIYGISAMNDGWKITTTSDAALFAKTIACHLESVNGIPLQVSQQVGGDFAIWRSENGVGVSINTVIDRILNGPVTMAAPLVGVGPWPEAAQVETEDNRPDNYIESVNFTPDIKSTASAKEVVAKWINGNEANVSAELSSAISKVNRMMFEMAELQRKISTLTSKLDESPIIQKIVSSILMAKRMPLVEDVFFSNDTKQVIIYTKELVTSEKFDNIARKVIGRMAFYISLQSLLQGRTDAALEPVLIKNRDRVFCSDDEKLFSAGHVKANGKVCFGAVTETLIKAMQIYDIEQICEVLIRFIQNPDFNDAWGEHLEYWPDYVETENVNVPL